MRKPGKKPRALKLGKIKAPKKEHLSQTTEHAKEVKRLMSGADELKVSRRRAERSIQPKDYKRAESMRIRAWKNHRPLEASPLVGAMVPIPRKWSTTRGRYCKFKAPGAGTYGLICSRPTIFG